MRLRLMLLVGATSSLVLVAFLGPLALLVRSVAADRAVSAAVVRAQALAPVVATVDEQALDLAVARANSSDHHPLTVFLPDGRVVGVPAARSDNVELAASGRSLTADSAGGREVLVAVSGLPEGTAVVRVFVSHRALTAGVGRAWLVLGLLGLGLLGVSLAVADRLARALLRPIRSAADASYRLAHGQLDARAAVDGPAEVRQVSLGLNLLAGRIDELLRNEREAAADLAHRIRTPLTALRVDAEALLDTGERARINMDLDAVERTVSEAIREARRPLREGIVAACDAAEVLAERMAFWAALAEEEGRRVTLAAPAGPVPVRVSRPDLSACLDALLDNVFTHTPRGCAFAVELVQPPSGGVRLTVADDGPGLPAPAVLGRGRSGRASTGLGLDIVRRTAAASGGSVTLAGSMSGGARVVVRLGSAAPTVPGRSSSGPPVAATRRQSSQPASS
jgi:signal transduction histidine kinase